MTTRFRVLEHKLPCQHIREYPNATKHKQEDVLEIAIKQYVPLDPSPPTARDAITIIAAHANGFVKEIYEPLWDDLLVQLELRGLKVRSIWIADASNQGASGVLNEMRQGDDTSWLDHSRDLLYMTNQFRHEMPRPIVGIAHSMGCVQLVNLAIMHPRLLSALILMEPVISNTHPEGSNSGLSIRRGDLWPTREAAEASFRKNKFGQTWDNRALECYLKYGLRPVPTAIHDPSISKNSVPASAVTLTTSKHQESWAYVRPNFEPIDDRTDRLLTPDLDSDAEGALLSISPESVITFAKLPFLRPSLLYIFGPTSNASSPERQDEKMRITGTGVGGSGGAAKGRVHKVAIDGYGHLVPMENPGACAMHSGEYLKTWLRSWKADEEWYKAYGSRKSDKDMLRASEEWVELVQKPTNTRRPVRGKL